MSKSHFNIPFGLNTTHFVSVHVHTNRAVMRCVATKLRGYPKAIDGFCWQANNPAVDGCVAEIHLAADTLDLDTIAHESSHAAFHRVKVLGVPHDHDDFQEWIAADTGRLTQAIVKQLKTLDYVIKNEHR